MLSYLKWKQLNESFAGAIPLGVTSPGSLGVRGGVEGTRLALEAKKKSRKYFGDKPGLDVSLDDEGGDDEGDEGGDMGGCKFCGKNSKKQSAKKSTKKSRKYFGDPDAMGDSMGGDDFGSSVPKLGKKKHPALGGDDDDLDLDGDGGDDDLDLDGDGGDDDLDLDGDGGGDDLDLDGDGGGDDLDLDAGGDDLGAAMGGPAHKGGPLNKHKPPMGGMDHMAMQRKMMAKKMKKKMKKESWWPDEDEWMQSVRSMLTPQNVKYGDGWTEYQEDALMAPADANAGLEQPGPGDVGFAPQQRVGQPLGGYQEQRRRRK